MVRPFGLLGTVLLAVALLVAAEKPQSYYEMLGVEKDASTATIRKAYRVMALSTHPDKAVNETDRELKTALFVKLANAYEVLSDSVSRARYDHLLSVGETEYDHHRNWDHFDQQRGFKPRGRPGQFRDAYAQFKQAEDEEFIALLISFGIAGLFALLPAYSAWRYRRSRRAKPLDKAQIRLDQEIAEEFRQEREAQKKAEKEEQRLMREERKRQQEEAAAARAAAGEEEDEEGQEDEEESVEEGESKARRAPKAVSLGITFKCDVCKTKYKSLRQLEAHENSKKHKDAVRKAGKGGGKEGKQQQQQQQQGGKGKGKTEKAEGFLEMEGEEEGVASSAPQQLSKKDRQRLKKKAQLKESVQEAGGAVSDEDE